MEKLSREEMREVKGGVLNGILYSCNYSPGGAYGVPFCHQGDPALHTDPSCSDVYSCIAGSSCGNPFDCP